MTQTQQAIEFGKALDKLTDYFAREFDMTYSSMVGELEFKKAELILQANAQDEDDD